MTYIKYQYRVLDRTTGKTLNIHTTRQDARSEKREWKAEGFDVAIVQSKYVHIIDREVR